LLEKNIYVDFGNSMGKNLEYSLSNDLAEIEESIKIKTKLKFGLDEVDWRINPRLSESVKILMSENNVNFSMTTYYESPFRIITINKRTDEKWSVYTIMVPEEYGNMSNKLSKEFYLSYFEEEGYKYKELDNDTISFDFEEDTYYIHFFSGDENFFQIYCYCFGDVGSVEKNMMASWLIHSLNSMYKCGKLFINNDSVIAAVELFIMDKNDFRLFFKRALSMIQEMADDFIQKIQNLYNEKERRSSGSMEDKL
jgi:hypothetical protein